jgi:hypothetical protein
MEAEELAQERQTLVCAFVFGELGSFVGLTNASCVRQTSSVGRRLGRLWTSSWLAARCVHLPFLSWRWLMSFLLCRMRLLCCTLAAPCQVGVPVLSD